MKSLVQQPIVELPPLSIRFDESNLSDRSPSLQHKPSAPPLPVDNVPEGGYDRVVVSACSLITAFYVGGFYSWGVMQAALANENVAQDSTLAFVGSLAVSWVALLVLCPTHGRFTGLTLNGFSAKNVAGLFFTNGIIVGLGNSLCFLVCGTLPAQWFERRRGLANGVVFAGGGLGSCVQSIVMQFLIDKLNIAWTFRIMGLATLVVTVPAATLLRGRYACTAATIDWSLFKDLKFLLLFFGSGIATFPLLVPPFFIPMYASSLNISGSLSSVLLALFNISSAVGRAGLGHFCDVVGPLSSLCSAIILSAISTLVIWPASNSLAPFVVFVLVTGLGNGGFFATMPTVVAHVYDSNVRVTFVMVVTSWSVGYIMGAPIAGWILELYGGSDAGRVAYRPAMYYSGSMSLCSLVTILIVRRLVNRRFFAFA